MTIRPETSRFIHNLECHANRKLSHPDEVAQLVDVARVSGRVDLFEDAVFLAKFLSTSFAVMKRIGPKGEGYDRLFAEFQASLEKVTKLLGQLAESAAPEAQQHFTAAFLSSSQDSLARLLTLLDDLALVKNWRVDGKPLP